MESTKERSEKYETKKLRNDGWNISKFDFNCKSTDPRSTINFEHKKQEENYPQAQVDHLTTNNKEKALKADKGGKYNTLCTEEQI